MKNKNEEVKLAKEGTIMAKFQKERTDAISEMFDNKYDIGLYPTSKFFVRLDKAVDKALFQQREEIKEMIRGKKIKWIKGSLSEKEEMIVKNVVDAVLDDILKSIK